MSYAYFPGCSAKGSGRSYEESLLAVFRALGTGLDEIKDWNCCGAAAYPSVDMAKAFALSARNLVLAEDGQPGSESVDVLAPCAGCYRALLKTERALADGGGMADRVGGALQAVGLRYEHRARARHPLDVLVNDIGLERDLQRCRAAARGVACCLLLRLPARAPVRALRRPARTDVDGAATGGGRRRADRLAAADALLRRFLLLRRSAHRRTSLTPRCA